MMTHLSTRTALAAAAFLLAGGAFAGDFQTVSATDPDVAEPPCAAAPGADAPRPIGLPASRLPKAAWDAYAAQSGATEFRLILLCRAAPEPRV